MSLINDSKEDIVKQSFFAFVQHHIDDANLSVIDEFLLTYIVGILEQIANQGNSEDAFDVDQFTEMMSAYLPEFTDINSHHISRWVFDLAHNLSKTQDAELDKETFEQPIAIQTDAKCDVDDIKFTEDLNNEDLIAESDINVGSDDEQINLLQEMFPSACSVEVRHCLCIADGDTEKAAQLILHRQEVGESLTTNTTRQAQKPIFKKEQNDNELRQHILSRYMYVDQLDDKREHKPVAPKWEPKKLVRYRNNQIVSLKGEKYTEVRSAEAEELKKTYVTLKPARQYRFH